MFTGIVTAMGHVAAVAPANGAVRLRVVAARLGLDDVSVGDSVAVAGCCLTVVAKANDVLDFDVSDETLRCVAGFESGCRVNLEKALRLCDRLGGHLMSGHVDGVGTVRAVAAIAGDRDGSHALEIELPQALARFVAAKGSIAVDGVSLTTNTITGARFTVNVIPHTLAVTTLGQLGVGAKVNLEVDLVARYLERLYDASR
jgi:riboflavin synthase